MVFVIMTFKCNMLITKDTTDLHKYCSLAFFVRTWQQAAAFHIAVAFAAAAWKHLEFHVHLHMTEISLALWIACRWWELGEELC